MDKSLRVDMCVNPSLTERRHGSADRRRFRRGGRRAGDIARAGLLAMLAVLLHSSNAAAQGPIGFGFDVNSVQAARANGMPTSYGSMWAGSWNQRWGWN